MPPLSDLRPGQRGRVVSLQGDAALVQRLMELGVLEGDEIEVVAFAPFGDPIEIRLGDTCLSLRRQEAMGIDIQL
jgi:ferrous iron transport protein A